MPGDILVSDQSVQGVLRADPLTGDRIVVTSSTVGVGPTFSKPAGLAVESGGQIVTLDETLFAIFRVDPVTGDRTIVSSSTVGTGPTFTKPTGLVLETSGNILVSDDGITTRGVFRVDPVTGNRTVVSSDTVGTGIAFSIVNAIGMESNGNILIADDGLKALLRVDPITGDRAIVSSTTAGTGVAFNTLNGVAVEASGDILVLDAGASRIHRVDPLTGDRTIVTSLTVGSGLALDNPNAITVEATGNILVTDAGPGALAVIRVDPVSGNRTVLSSANVGTGTPIGKPRGIAVVPPAPGGVCGDGTLNVGEQCDDGNVTAGDCCSPTCTLEPNGSSCDDLDPCTTADACAAGACVGGPPPDCSAAGDACNTASCDPAGLPGNCDTLTPVADGTACDDGVACTDAVCTAGSCVFAAHTGQVSVSLEIEALSDIVVRDVTFVITTCPSAPDTRVVPVALDATGMGSTLLTNVDAGAQWIGVSEGHTLRRLAPLVFSACAATVDLTATNRLRSGDFHTATVPQDNLTDITDFSILAAVFNAAIDPNVSVGADATGDGFQSTADFTAIQVNFLQVGQAVDGCAAAGRTVDDDSIRIRPVRQQADERAAPKSAVPLEALRLEGKERADLNGDGWVDLLDVRAFARQYHLLLLPEFERRTNRLRRDKRPRVRR